MTHVMTSEPCSGCGNQATVVVSDEQWEQLNTPNGPHIQHILSDVEPDIREQFISGLCGACFDDALTERIY